MDLASQLPLLPTQNRPGGGVLCGPARVRQGAAAAFWPLARGAERAAPPPAAGSVLHVGISPREWILAASPAETAPSAHVPWTLARAVAGRVRDPDGEQAELAVLRVRPPAMAPEFPVMLHHRPGRAVVYCSAGEVTECGARVLSELAAAIGLPAPGWGGPLRVELQLVGHSALVDEGLHPAVAFGKAAGGVTLVRARVCASLLTGPAAETIGRLWTQQPGCFAAARSPAGAGGVKIPRSGGTARARLRAGVRQVRS